MKLIAKKVGLLSALILFFTTGLAAEGFVFPLETCYVGAEKVSCNHQNARITAHYDHDRDDTIVEMYTGDKGVNAGAGDYDRETNPVDQCTLPQFGVANILNEVGLNYIGSAFVSDSLKPRYLCYDDHTGTDFSTRHPTKDEWAHNVLAMADGRVEFAGFTSTGLGIVEINHDKGVAKPYSSRYLHLDSVNVLKGDYVFAGKTVVGVSGNSGGFDPHLDVELRDCMPEQGMCDNDTPARPIYGIPSDVKVDASGNRDHATVGRSSLWKNWPIYEIETQTLLKPRDGVPNIPEKLSIHPITDIDYTGFTVTQCSKVEIEIIGLEGGKTESGFKYETLPYSLFKINNNTRTEIPLETCSLDGLNNILNPGEYELQVGGTGITADRSHNYTQKVTFTPTNQCSATKLRKTLQKSCEDSPPPTTPVIVSPGLSGFPGPELVTNFPNFFWNESTNASHYEIFIYSLGGGFGEVYKNLNVTTTTLQSALLTLPTDSSYSWRVRAVSRDGQKSDYSAFGYFQLVSNGSSSVTPSAPSITSPGTSASAVLTITDARPIFRWEGVSDVERYGLYIRDQETGDFVFFEDNISGEATSLRLPRGLFVDGRSYKWNMSAFNDQSVESSISNSLYFIYEEEDQEFVDVEASGFRIDDNSSGGSVGDDDGLPENGETVDLDLFVRNTGSEAFEDFEMILKTNESCVDIPKDSQTVSNLLPSQRRALGGFLVELVNCEDGDIISFTIELSGEQGHFEVTESLQVFETGASNANLVITALDIEDDIDDQGNDDGDINAGETLDIVFEITNIGSEKSGSLRSNLSGQHQCLQINNSSIQTTGIKPNSIKYYNYEIKIDGECPTPNFIDVVHTLEDGNGRWEESYRLTVYENQHRPDLAITSLQYTGEELIRAGDQIGFTVEYTNIGDLNPGDHEVAFMYSFDEFIELSDMPLQVESDPKIDPGTSDGKTINTKRVNEVGQGYIGICILRAEGETNTSNNCSDAFPVNVLDQLVPDLVLTVGGLDNQSFPIRDFDGFPKVLLNVKNRGKANSPDDSYVQIYISRDFPTVNSNSFAITSDRVSILGVDQVWEDEMRLPLPDQLGVFWATFCVDAVRDEKALSNNCTQKRFEVRPLAVDRAIQSITVSEPTSPDDRYTAGVTVNNTGDNSEFGSVKLSISPSSQFDESEVELGSKSLNYLFHNRSEVVEFEFSLAETDGDFWLKACSTDVDGESNPDNDCLVRPLRQDEEMCFPVLMKSKKLALICF